MYREPASKTEISGVLQKLSEGLQKRIDKHGLGKFVSRAEALGVLAEEYHEVIEAIRGNNSQEFLDEMMDVAVSAIWAIVSLPLLEKEKCEYCKICAAIPGQRYCTNCSDSINLDAELERMRFEQELNGAFGRK